MKKLILGILILGLVSCQDTTTTNNDDRLFTDVAYYKHAKTGLCFALLENSFYNNHEGTCVPCDSLRNAHVILIP